MNKNFYLIPLIFSWIGGIIATVCYFSTRKGLGYVISIWVLIILATIAFIEHKEE